MKAKSLAVFNKNKVIYHTLRLSHDFFCQFPSNRRQSLLLTNWPPNSQEMVTGDICARRSRICSKLVYNKKTSSKEDQTRNWNFPQRSKALPSSKACSNKVQLRSALERGVFEITAFAKRNQTSPHNCLLPWNLAPFLNDSWNFLLTRSNARPHQQLNTKTL